MRVLWDDYRYYEHYEGYQHYYNAMRVLSESKLKTIIYYQNYGAYW